MSQSQKSIRRPSMLARWAGFAVRHRWQVLGGWLVALLIVGTAALTVGGDFVDDFEIPGAESQQAVDILTERFPSQAGDSATLVFQSDTGVTDPAIKSQIETLVAEAATLPEVAGVASPFDTAGAISADGLYAYAAVQYTVASTDVDANSIDRLTEFVDNAAGNGLRVEVGGTIVAATEFEEPSSSEAIGIAVAMVIMLLMFGSVVAMGLPIITALIGLGIGILVTQLAANVISMGSITTAFITMIGLGVGIDYALFIVNRYRDGLREGLSVERSIVRAVDTSGRAVMFAGLTVAIALLGLLAMGIPFVGSLGIAAAFVVIASVLVAIVFMPALLAVVGKSVLRFRVPGLGNGSTGTDSFWYRWGRAIQRRPRAVAVVVIAFLALLAVPFFDMRLGLSDAGNNPETFHTRRAYDLLAEGFGPGFNGPLLVVLEKDGGFDPAALAALPATISAAEGVAAVSQAMPNPEAYTAIMQVFPNSSPQDEATSELVDRLRTDVLPPALAGSGMEAYVGGGTATNIDLSDKITERMPLFFAVVIGLSLLLLTVVFRSVVVPIKAALMNLLSIGAGFGAVVAVFQWGWGKGLLGVDQTGPVESFIPMILFGIIFGLSMDYEVFLVSRVREEFVHRGDGRAAMLAGIGSTGKVVAAAGAIMTAVFFAFVLGDSRVIKEIGFGLGVAILVDAFMIRLMLVPAVMTMLGNQPGTPALARPHSPSPRCRRRSGGTTSAIGPRTSTSTRAKPGRLMRMGRWRTTAPTGTLLLASSRSRSTHP